MDDDKLFGTDDGIYPPFPPKKDEAELKEANGKKNKTTEENLRHITSVQLIHSAILGLILGGVLVLIFAK